MEKISRVDYLVADAPGHLGRMVGSPHAERLDLDDLSVDHETARRPDIEVLSDIEVLTDFLETDNNGSSVGTMTDTLDDADVRVGTPPPLELHEIQAHVQRELASLDVAVIPNKSRLYRLAKRMLDLVIAVPVLVLAAPVIGILALLIRLESAGPAVFRQQRVGLDGRVFTFYKFRTMYVDAKERFPELYDYSFDSSELSSRYYKCANDPRNTRLGAFIRQTTLDELPNLFNVVKGDTSIVGPRPELPEMIPHYQASELVKFGVKPGLTCLAACTGRNTLTIDEQIRADVEYVVDQSFKLDLWIISETARMILKAIGAE
jgi:lipopolysaccharide/colanic/teichoic acid biosynthesis glycosyltransferase